MLISGQFVAKDLNLWSTLLFVLFEKLNFSALWGPLNLLWPLKKAQLLVSWPFSMPLKTRSWMNLFKNIVLYLQWCSEQVRARTGSVLILGRWNLLADSLTGKQGRHLLLQNFRSRLKYETSHLVLKVRKYHKEIVVSSILPKKQRKISLLAATVSKKWANQKNEGFVFVGLFGVLKTPYFPSDISLPLT